MKYSSEFVDKIVDRLLSGAVSKSDIQRVLNIPRKTLSRWLNRKLSGNPARLKRRAKRVWNKTVQPALDKMKKLLDQGKSSAITWIDLGKTCLRTVQRYKKQWFPPVKKTKLKAKRYERKHVFSLMHTDWGVKRIKNGVRCCFSFYVDDCSRKLYALQAYPKASLENTIHNFKTAVQKTRGFKSVLTDCGGVYRKNFDKQMKGIKHIRTRPFNPKCNGKAESIVKKVKNHLKQFMVRDLNHANQILSRFQRDYNNTPHSSLKYRSPNQVFKLKKRGVISAVT
jgi:transposase InsO family protein